MTVFDKIRIVVKTIIASTLNKVDSPIFIIGTGRCGSDLLVEILSTNRSIQIDKNELYDLFLPALEGGKDQIPVYSDIVNYKLTVKKSLKKWTPFYRLKIKTIIQHKILGSNNVFILKSPALTFLLEHVNKLFPDARYIHLYRNGLSVSKSWCQKEYNRVDAYREQFSEEEFLIACANYYNDSIIAIKKFLAQIENSKKHELSYEGFCSDPEIELKKICEFINVHEKCTFDLSKIMSTNYKVNNLELELKDLLENTMKPSLKLLGYL